jgi:16S rRNA (adenine1518-N6/adenine1519-N6)-dimethyltransferase
MTQLPLRYTQNFLTSTTLVKKLVAMAQIEPNTAVLEIGPGQGIITTPLAQRVGSGGQLIALELDPDLLRQLQNKLRHLPQLRLIHADILQFDLTTLPPDYTVFANIPFNITAPLLTHLFNPTSGPRAAHLILQTDSLLAPGPTLKALLLYPLYTITPTYQFVPTDFRPVPAVPTTLFSFQRRTPFLLDPTAYPLYQDFLAFIARDRVGEGAWRQLFSPAQMNILLADGDLIPNRGLKGQTAEAVWQAFVTFQRVCGSKHGRVSHAFSQLRENQQRTTHHNLTAGHRPPKQKPPKPRNSE